MILLGNLQGLLRCMPTPKDLPIAYLYCHNHMGYIIFIQVLSNLRANLGQENKGKNNLMESVNHRY